MGVHYHVWLTHDHRWVYRICEPGNILRIRYNISPSKLHVNSKIDVGRATWRILLMYLLQRNICVVLCRRTEALGCFHTLGSDACLREGKHQPSQKCHDRR